MDGQLISRSLGIDLIAGVAVAAAVAWAIWIFGVPPVVLLCLAGVAFVRVFASLRRLHTAAPLQFQHFEAAPLEFMNSDDVLANALDRLPRPSAPWPQRTGNWRHCPPCARCNCRFSNASTRSKPVKSR